MFAVCLAAFLFLDAQQVITEKSWSRFDEPENIFTGCVGIKRSRERESTQIERP